MSSSSHQSDGIGYREGTLRAQDRSLSWEEQLFLAIDQGDVRRVKHLLVKGANVNATHPTGGRTPLGLAAHIGNVEILKMLLQPLKGYTASDCLVSFGGKCRKNEKEGEDWCGSTASKGKATSSILVDRRLKPCSDMYSNQGSKNTYQTNFKKDSFSSEDETSDNSHITLINNRKCTGRAVQGQDRSDEGENVPLKIEPNDCVPNSADDLQDQSLSYSPSLESANTLKEKIEANQGYFIVVHNECSSEEKKLEDEFEKYSCDENLTEAVTPDGMDNLEWDSEVQLEVCNSPEEKRDTSDSWVDLYRWYADYLAETCGVDRSVRHSSSLHIDVNQLDMYRRSAMHYAAETGNLEVLRILLSAGGLVDIGDSDDVTPLHLAAARDYPEAVALLISCGAKVNRKSIDGTGPLHMAAARGFMETARILLEQGACVNALDRSDRTALHLAVSRGLEDMVNLLISHGAKVNVEDILGYTPLCQAVWQQEKEIVKLLLSAGAKLTHSDRLLHCAILHRCPDIAKLLISAGSIVNLRDDSGDTPLIIAARSGQTDVVKLLLKNGAMASYPNGLTGSTPLHEAVECLRPAQYSELREIVISLLNNCGPSGLLNIESSSAFDVPLVRALVHDRDHAMILLIQYGADVNVLQKHTPIVSDEYLRKRPSRWVIAHLMISAGLKLWECSENIRHGVKYPDDSPASWISSVKYNPMSLCELSRLRFRFYHGENLYRAVNRSGLPKQLIKYIMLEESISVENYLQCCK